MGVLSLENFEDVADLKQDLAPDTGTADPELQRVSGYEKGYQAGWDDAVQSSRDCEERLDEELGRNLEELSFSFFEAQRHVCLSLEALIRTLTEKVLPMLLRETFGQMVTELIEPLIEETANLTVELVCAQSDLEIVRSTVADHKELPFTVRVEPSFAKHQVRLQLGHEVREIDGEQLLSDLRTAIDSHLSQLQEPVAHVS